MEDAGEDSPGKEETLIFEDAGDDSLGKETNPRRSKGRLSEAGSSKSSVFKNSVIDCGANVWKRMGTM